MQIPFLWFGLAIVAWLIALLSKRRPHRDAWPAYLFALPLAIQVAHMLDSVHAPLLASIHETALLLQQIASATFLALLVVLFASRQSVSGPRATRSQRVVALLGTFILYAVAFIPVQPSSSTGNLLASSVVALAGTGFAIWSLATLGRCFGIFPEARGLVLRGPYRLVRHPVYLGEVTGALGLLLTRPHVLTLILLLVFIGFQYWRTVFEERALAAAFPNEYPVYRARVPRLVPGWRPSAAG